MKEQYKDFVENEYKKQVAQIMANMKKQKDQQQPAPVAQQHSYKNIFQGRKKPAKGNKTSGAASSRRTQIDVINEKSEHED